MTTSRTISTEMQRVKICIGVFILLCSFSYYANAQLSGNYTIGKGGDYESFTDAAAELNKVGVSGLVTFSVMSGTYNEQFTLGVITNTNLTRRVIFQSQTGNPEDVILSFDAIQKDANYIVRLQGSKYIQFVNLGFDATGLGRAFQLEAAASDIAISGCAFSGIFNTNAAEDQVLIYSVDPDLENLNIIENHFSSCSFGIYLQGLWNNHIPGVRILDNTFSNTGYTSIYLNRVHNPLISGNIIQGGYLGIYVTSGEAAITLVKNSVSVSGHGIKINYFGNLEPGLIANNFILVDGVSESYGLDIQNSSWLNVYHNTVVIKTHIAYAHAFNCNSNTAGTIRVMNNSFSCMNEGYASYVQYPATLLQSDYNNYYSSSSMMFYRGQKAYDLADLKTLGAHDQHSVSVWPGHLSDTDLHTYTGWLANKGFPVEGVTDDIDGDPRDTEHPDIGADEFSIGTTLFLPPLSGDYPVGPGQTYENLQDLFDVLKVRGVSSDLYIRLTTGIHDEQAELVTIPGSGPDKWIHITRPMVILEGDSVALRYNATSYEDNYILRLKGADFISITGIKFHALNSTYQNMIELAGGADSVYIANNTFRSVTPYGIQDRTAIVSDDGYYKHREIKDNSIYGSKHGIMMRRKSQYVDYPEGLLISGNTMEDIGSTGIYLYNHHSPDLLSNTIEAATYGMLINQCTGQLRVEKNKLDVQSQYGLYISSIEANQLLPSMISNNFIHVGGTGKAYGLYVNNSNFLNIDYNSIHITSTSASDGRAFYSTSGSEYMLRNNIFANTGGGYAYYVTTTSAIRGSDYNDIYTTGTNLAYWDGNHSDLSSLQGANYYHQHCISADPEFVSATDLHASAEALKGSATPILSVTDDIDGDLRHLSTPDIGADQFSGGGSAIFTELAFDNPGYAYGNATWVDYDRDQDLDILVAGSLKTAVYYNENDHFYLDEGLDLVGLSRACVSVNNYNNDGDPDFLLLGEIDPGNSTSIIYENTGQAFTPQPGITGLYSAESEWADFDNDGDQDLLVTGTTDAGLGFTRIYMNENYELVEKVVGVDVKSGSVAVADYDNDGDIDFVLSGKLGDERITCLYSNINGEFVQTEDQFDGMNIGDLEWGDYDNDGDFDLLISGMTDLILDDYTGTAYKTMLYENTEDGFRKSEHTFRGFIRSDAEWGDYDSDGDLDFIISGLSYDGVKTLVYNNDDGVFIEVDALLPGVQEGSVAWGDYDQDGDLDILICGTDENNLPIAKVYTNYSESAGEKPDGPTNLKVTAADKYAVFSWEPGSDDETPTVSLTYNLIVGTQEGFRDVVNGFAWPDGTRQVVGNGNMQNNIRFKLRNLLPGTTYYWKAQSVDQSYRTSTFADGGSFTTIDQLYSTNQYLRSGIKDGEMDFGDFDNDGDLDLILCGMTDEGRITEIYVNDAGIFTKLDIDLPGVDQSDVEWGDYDNDGFLDFILCGRTASFEMGIEDPSATFLYRNIDGHSFNLIPTVFTNIRKGVVTWGDCDNDGDLDLLLSGCENTEDHTTEIYINLGNDDFKPIVHEIPLYRYVDGAWVDYDNDGDLDFFLTGDVYDRGLKNELYKNNGDYNFSPVNYDFADWKDGAAVWGDYDNDGDLDLFNCGQETHGLESRNVTYLYKNLMKDNFEEFFGEDIGIASIYNASMELADFDNDGDLDLLVAGDGVCGIYSNEGNEQFTFHDLNTPTIHRACARWADWNNDGTLDLVIFGDGMDYVSSYKSNFNVSNIRPSPPNELNISFRSNDLFLEWNKAIDAETSYKALSYNIKIGTSSGAFDIKTADSYENGMRKNVRLGNANLATKWKLEFDQIASCEYGKIYWSVQAIDHVYAGSAFAPEYTIDLSGEIISVMDVPFDQGGKVMLNWNASDLDHNRDYLTYYSIWRALPAGKKSAETVTGIEALAQNNDKPILRTTNTKGETLYWEWVANQPAHKLPVYAYTCPTVNDSMSGYNGMHEFMISAHTSDPNVYFDSEPASGYSVDNLAPAAPMSLAAEKKDVSVVLTWSPNSEADLKQYLVYRSESPDINPAVMEPYATVKSNAFTDNQLPGDGTIFYYVVCAQDVHENISMPGNEVMAMITGLLDRRTSEPGSYALYPVYPNPFIDEALIAFDIPEQSGVSIELYTVVGDKVETILLQELPAGSYTYTWKTDDTLPAGTYICVLRAGERSMVRRMIKGR
ncbi:MAG: VCBS repeat-containing protein [Bacteroidales bacterium]|nr:VCBS repeat-containing protein [Bacteroidales bacterium]MBN2699107.1 VCBS repeat-containing protein [Bacteroidales bacterium]